MGWGWNTGVRSAPTMCIWAGKHLLFDIGVMRRSICMCNRKNFERHFQESRHAFGMRALGLPNTKHFHEITKIEDAMTCTYSLCLCCSTFDAHVHTRTVAERLKREGKHEIFEQETMEELEDEEGNVYNRKTFDDLKKQGLI